MSYLRTVEKGTSVKSLGIIEEPTATKPGVFDFVYRDQYSILDWGKMPMPDGKVMDNRPVALVAAFNHEHLRRYSIPTCYLNPVDDAGVAKSSVDWFRENGQVPRTLRMQMVNVLKPVFDEKTGKWDYSVFKDPPVNNYVHPIEFIWRAEAGPDSSFWKNVTKGSYKLSDFGLPADLKPGDKFPAPIFDHSSKYEDHDRYFSPAVAYELGDFNVERWEKLNRSRYWVNRLLTDHAESVGLRRPDSKQEFVVMMVNGTLVDALGDVAGTWHEDRYEHTTKGGKLVKVSKQTPRDLHKLQDPAWVKQCEEAKAKAEKEGHPDWKAFVSLEPRPLEAEFFDQYNNLMYAASNAWVKWNAFPQASSLEKACVEFDRYLSDYKERLKKTA
ncbi:Phosphoribosylaminoimidazole-succinocarboxamide synthase [uncultured archaeon]|nr:Phosphoribosylaminoimidazole-succinocarboxamide synthase [uncultured archaeon]